MLHRYETTIARLYNAIGEAIPPPVEPVPGGLSGNPAAAAPAAMVSSPRCHFEASASFEGARDGYVFKCGALGLGYYFDTRHTPAPATSVVSVGRTSAAIPAKIVRAPPVGPEPFDPVRYSSYPGNIERGFMPENLPFTGHFAALHGRARPSRLGAFEVYLILLIPSANGETQVRLAGLHSKLYTRLFPRADAIVRRCQTMLRPLFAELLQRQEAEDAPK